LEKKGKGKLIGGVCDDIYSCLILVVADVGVVERETMVIVKLVKGFPHPRMRSFSSELLGVSFCCHDTVVAVDPSLIYQYMLAILLATDVIYIRYWSVSCSVGLSYDYD